MFIFFLQTDTKDVLKNLVEFIQIRGTPDHIKTDRGTGLG